MNNPLERNAETDPEVEQLASAFHEDWRATRLQEDGSYEPRVKPTTDEIWSAEHGGVAEVDIANTSFDALPADWQEENRAAAQVAQGELNLGLNTGADITSQEFIENAATSIHVAWLERNPWAKGGELDVPYAQLPTEEKIKDDQQIVTAVLLHQNTNSGV